jgi:hypothetical protein
MTQNFDDWRHGTAHRSVVLPDSGKIRSFIIKVLDDPDGINQNAFNALKGFADKDILDKVENLDNRYFLPENHGL